MLAAKPRDLGSNKWNMYYVTRLKKILSQSCSGHLFWGEDLTLPKSDFFPPHIIFLFNIYFWKKIVKIDHRSKQHSQNWWVVKMVTPWAPSATNDGSKVVIYSKVMSIKKEAFLVRFAISLKLWDRIFYNRNLYLFKIVRKSVHWIMLCTMANNLKCNLKLNMNLPLTIT